MDTHTITVAFGTFVTITLASTNPWLIAAFIGAVVVIALVVLVIFIGAALMTDGHDRKKK